MAKPWENASGLPDPSAYAATRPTEDEIRVSKLVKALRAVAELFGFDIINRMEFRDKRTERMYR